MNEKTTITVLTPAYNRAKNLINLYKSLCQQTSGNFQWFVVDDGSTDETKSVIETMMKEERIPICYIYKANGGKHTALNIGINHITSDLTFIVDSDDILTDDAIEVITHCHERYKQRSDLCGYVFLKQYPDGRINGKLFEPDERIDSYISVRINGDDIYADKAEVFRTECLKEFPFPIYRDEKFLGEDIVWVRMGRKYDMVHVNRSIYIAQYLEEGLTKNRRRNNIQSPVGCMNRAREYMKKDIKMKYRIRSGLQYIIYGMFAGYSPMKLFHESDYQYLTFICLIPGIVLYNKWKRKYMV